jgi:transcriptional regulator with XRE-family HTH domain
MSQEDFDEVSSRVYISALERGIKQPTLRKIDDLAACMGVHPLTLLVLAYCRKANADDAIDLYERVLSELDGLFEKGQVGDPPPGAAPARRT